MKSNKSQCSDEMQSDPHGLTLAQQNAVDLLAAGKNDTETAKTLNLNRVTVTRWRLYSIEFRAALAERRAAVWGATADRLRTLLPKAIDTLADALENADDKPSVAIAILKLVGPLPLLPTGPIDAETILQREVERERELLRSRQSTLLDSMNDLPDIGDHVETVRKRLKRMAPACETEQKDNQPSEQPKQPL